MRMTIMPQINERFINVAKHGINELTPWLIHNMDKHLTR